MVGKGAVPGDPGFPLPMLSGGDGNAVNNGGGVTMVEVSGGRGGEEGGLDVVEPFRKEGVDFLFLSVPRVLNVKVEVPHDEVFAMGGGEIRQGFSYFRAPSSGWKVYGVDGEGVCGSPFLDVDCENAAGDNDIFGHNPEAVGDKNGNAALGAASRGVGGGSMSHIAGGEELLPEGGIGVKPMRLREADNVVGESS